MSLDEAVSRIVAKEVKPAAKRIKTSMSKRFSALEYAREMTMFKVPAGFVEVATPAAVKTPDFEGLVGTFQGETHGGEGGKEVLSYKFKDEKGADVEVTAYVALQKVMKAANLKKGQEVCIVRDTSHAKADAERVRPRWKVLVKPAK